MYSYEREEHILYLENLVKDGTYQDFENEVFQMNELRKKILSSLDNLSVVMIDSVVSLIDQVDGIYYADIGFHLTNVAAQTLPLSVVAKTCVNALAEHGVKQTEDSLYYNEVLQMFMFTSVAIRNDDGPNLYGQKERLFVVR